MNRILTIAVVLSGILSLGHSVDFQSEIFPVLKNRCGKCHMDGEAKGKVSLDADQISKEIGADGSIIPGDVKGSDLHWTMTLPPDDDLCMPPKGPRVPKEEIDLIAKWIAEGAKLEGGTPSSPGGSMTDAGMTGDMTGGGAAMAGGGMTGAPAARAPYEGVFKNNKGMQVPAKLTAIDGDRAILVLPDGKSYRYPIAMFAPETQEIVRKFQAGTLEPSQ